MSTLSSDDNVLNKYPGCRYFRGEKWVNGRLMKNFNLKESESEIEGLFIYPG